MGSHIHPHVFHASIEPSCVCPIIIALVTNYFISYHYWLCRYYYTSFVQFIIGNFRHIIRLCFWMCILLKFICIKFLLGSELNYQHFENGVRYQPRATNTIRSFLHLSHVFSIGFHIICLVKILFHLI